MMIILTAAALAAAQPASAPQAPAGQPASHGAEHAAHGRMQHGQDCPCCDHDGADADRDCCAHMQQRDQHDRH